MTWIKSALRTIFLRVESLCTWAFGADHNPLLQLGALGWLCFWMVAVSGLYLYIFFDTGVTQAYESLQSITHTQWYAGGVLRSVHRYASDALVVIAVLHMLREFSLDRLRGVRWFAWLTGLVALALIYVCGITGYWVVWDRLAEYVARVTSQWLDALPIFGESIARNFASNAAINGRFFTLMVYIHIAAPLIMLLVMWLHIQRYNYAAINPKRRLAISFGAAMLALALIRPAISQAPADLDHAAVAVNIDWFYLPVYPLVDNYGGVLAWWSLLIGAVLLAALPWLPPLRRAPVAVVHLSNCNGCSRCFDDCPFGAITMERRTDGSAFEWQAVVDADQCTSCGLCMGSCPTATPFRRATELVPGIELPSLTLQSLREQGLNASQRLSGKARVLVFRCSPGATMTLPANAASIELPCLGALPPSFIDFVLSKRLADGVMLAGCREGDCRHRLGMRWTQERVQRQRDPYLRIRVPREHVALSFDDDSARALSEFQEHLQSLASGKSIAESPSSMWRLPDRVRGWVVRYALQIVVLGVGAALVGYLSVNPAVKLLEPEQSLVTLTFTHAAERREPCAQLTPEERMRLQPNMQRPTQCARNRWPVDVELRVDDQLLYAGRHEAAGLWNDGPASVFKRFKVPSGARRIAVRLRDNGAVEWPWQDATEITLEPRRNLVVEFDGRAFSFK